ncbi:helix-turn-helix domain-containing protein [Jonquetella anthropi]|uniref:helix-turn-helix domain-containing protein n=1 Tax=Jonquetella anthropi TaxID=428712 RepID=UPI0001B915CB|nr:DNA-binding helix-turn-helix protein [Jonquetella anthropi E3_33 E1]
MLTVTLIEFVLKAAIITRRELARKIGRTTQSIYRWEHKNVSPQKRDLDRMAELLGISTGEMLQQYDAVCQAQK